MKKIFLVLILALSLNANWRNGNEFVNDMKESIKFSKDKSGDLYSALAYHGYVDGVRDTLIDAQYICIPQGVTGGQIYSVIEKFILNNPEKWNNSASYLVETPLLNTFPCKKKK